MRVTVLLAMLLGCKGASPSASEGEKPARGAPRPVLHVSHQLAVISADAAGNDNVADLAMIFRYHGITASFDEITKALSLDQVGKTNALAMLKTAEHFGLQVRGVQFDTEVSLHLTSSPYIAHIIATQGPFPRPLDHLDGRFVVVEQVADEIMTIIDPVMGSRRDVALKVFMETASGVALLFDDDGAAAGR
jgi:ABC-type bacteriocin/lantibiotic exporter with double-glycine peptidase domain